MAASMMMLIEASALLESVETRELLLTRVLEKHPTLSHDGVGITEDFEEDRHELWHALYRSNERLDMCAECQGLRPLGLYPEIPLALEYLAYCAVPTKQPRYKVGSYSLKHWAERHAKNRKVEYAYVSNGSMIAAALMLGVKIRNDPNSPNVDLSLIKPKKCSECPKLLIPMGRGYALRKYCHDCKKQIEQESALWKKELQRR